MSLNPRDFHVFFRALNGEPPFPWQERLAQRVIGDTENPWPDVIAAPTASGKTACIDIALFALAYQADRRPSERTTPRRICFIVDRRVVVDEAFERAKRIRMSLESAHDGVLADVAAALRRVASGPTPLECVLLRGGVYRDEGWTANPLQPAVIASTVDQVGSRLLFRGYGLTSFAHPIHAGLMGNDALLILDEAHCANAFRETLASIRRYRRWADRYVPAPFHLVTMTATPGSLEEPHDVFRIGDADRDPNSVLGRRFAASKAAELVEVPVRKGIVGEEQFAIAIAEKARELAGGGSVATAVLVNRVRSAARVAQELKTDAHVDVELLTGRMRPLDRDEVVDRVSRKVGARRRHALERPLFVVATQCLEVGADFDFDMMVSECASLDSLRQRFGRLNRLGRPVDARAAILIRSDALSAGEDRVYGSALARTWGWLNEARERALVDVGVNVLDAHLEAFTAAGGDVRELIAPVVHAPVLMPSHLDLLVQTDPEPLPNPDIATFLHGPSSDPDVQVCWRVDLSVEAPELQDWRDTVALCPPSAPECMPVPLSQVRRWLTDASQVADGPDLETATPEDDREQDPAVKQTGGPPRRVALRWRGSENPRTSLVIAETAREIGPGDVLVIPASLQPWSALGTMPEGAPVDRAEEAALEAGRAARVRLQPAVLATWPISPARAQLDRIASGLEEPESSVVLDALRQCSAEGPTWLRRAVDELDHPVVAEYPNHPANPGLVIASTRSRRQASPRALVDVTFTSDDDTSSAGGQVSLAAHCRHVKDVVITFGEGLGLNDTLTGLLGTAAAFHDAGKCDPRFQGWLRGGSTLEALVDGLVLAKSERLALSSSERRLARVRSGYPEMGRHELLSVALLESAADILATIDDPDLLLHLVASHHGRCRPFAPNVDDPSPIDVHVTLGGHTLRAPSRTDLEKVGSGLAERFWTVIRRYGYWGSAWLEAVLRLADHEASERERTGLTHEVVGA